MDTIFFSYGYPALFLVSFLASTVVPLGSEWLLVSLVMKGYDPLLSVAVATVGNTLGSCTTYGIGIWGGPYLIRRVLRISETAQERAERIYSRYGSWSLLFSWVPIVGDPLCIVGGLLRVRFRKFSILVFSGKLVRYTFISGLTLMMQAT